MQTESNDPYKLQTDLLKAMAHPVRLHILEILSNGEACVCHLTAILDQRQPYVSQQLMVLRQAQLVVADRDGNVIYYQLADPSLAQAVESIRHASLATFGPLDLPDIPEPPISGCTCPRCMAANSADR